MATHTTTYQTDDLTGEQADTILTQHFAYGVNYYKIDLTPENMKKFDAVMGRWLKAAQPSTRIQFHAQPGADANGKASTPDGVTAEEIRAWGRANGHTVNERGRVSGELVAAYNSAHENDSEPAPNGDEDNGSES